MNQEINSEDLLPIPYSNRQGYGKIEGRKNVKEIFMIETIKGKVTYKDGSVYEGDLVNGKPHGKGKLTYIYGSVYEGDWVDGEQTGLGKMTYPDGKFDEGRFMNSEFVGGS
ncbi:hypothetical protein [Treponema sp. R8-4-B8]